MRIAQVAPLFESVPPKRYGGTERVVSYLTEALVALGHEVTLFAAGDSMTRAELVSCWPAALGHRVSAYDSLIPNVMLLERVIERADDFDVIHFHQGVQHFSWARRLQTPHLTTLHGRLDLPELQPLFSHFDDVPVASISDAQRSPVPQADWRGTVYHGLPVQLHQPSKRPEGYFAFLGRISPEKRVDRAIAIAESLRVPLKIAAKVDREDAAYFEREIKPLLSSPYVEFLGDIGERQKSAFLGGARALLFPIDWPEPFGLVMIEALACGTPVVACDHGSVPEVLEDGVTGFIVKTVDEAIAAAAKVDTLDRRACRDEFERRFCAKRMARDYVEIYASLAERTSGVSLSANLAMEEAP